VSAWSHSPRRATASDRRGWRGANQDEFLEHLLTACVLLLLHETPASSRGLHDGLADLGFDEDPARLQHTLEAMEDLGLLFSTWGQSANAPERHTFHVAPEGRQWLRQAASELQSTEGFLGAFVARCREHFLTTT
jgi:DNA-binding PadR family transcriptional regulator